VRLPVFVADGRSRNRHPSTCTTNQLAVDVLFHVSEIYPTSDIGVVSRWGGVGGDGAEEAEGVLSSHGRMT